MADDVPIDPPPDAPPDPPPIDLDPIHLRAIGWVLDAETGEPRREPDILAWATWMATDRRRQLGDDRLGQVRVSTIFLGLDQSWSGPPILYETMVFGGIFHGEQQRYQTRDEARLGHAAWVLLIHSYRTAPRRIRKSVRKLQLWHQRRQPITHGDLRRVWQFRRFRQHRTPAPE